MYKRIFVLLFFIGINLFAQELDSTVANDDFFKEKSKKHWWKNWKEDWTLWELKGVPFIEANYGFGSIDNKNMNYDFAKVGMAELKLGYSTRKNFYDEKVINFKDRYFFISRIGSDLESKNAKYNELRSSIWRFGFNKRKGYGYKLNDFYLLPYNSSGFVWTGLNMKDYPPTIWPAVYPPLEGQLKAEKDAHFLERINQTLKFGTINETGINFDFASSIGLNVGYETTVVFPRHLFWKHLGSLIIESAGEDLLGRFINEIAESSPISLPFVNFILKGAYQYAFYTLKKDKMNWPFNSEAPLTYEHFKLGITFTF
ncbi:MAG: hypothetical protein N2321_02705 [Melioribacteraceae bacterium]|nr:hypothetical protein [Melioribacteraceae bacterium]